MNEAILKAKVLFGFGLLAAFFGMLYTPELVRSVVPFVICVFLASAVLFIPELIAHAKSHLASNNRNKNQATPLFGANRNEVSVRVNSVPHVDYDNYLIPSYLRCQEVK